MDRNFITGFSGKSKEYQKNVVPPIGLFKDGLGTVQLDHSNKLYAPQCPEIYIHVEINSTGASEYKIDVNEIENITRLEILGFEFIWPAPPVITERDVNLKIDNGMYSMTKIASNISAPNVFPIHIPFPGGFVDTLFHYEYQNPRVLMKSRDSRGKLTTLIISLLRRNGTVYTFSNFKLFLRAYTINWQ